MFMRFERLNQKEKERRKVVITKLIFETVTDETFMKYIITGDETWIYEFDIKIKRQSSKWRQRNKPKRSRQSRSIIKILLTVFFNYHVVIHTQRIPTD